MLFNFKLFSVYVIKALSNINTSTYFIDTVLRGKTFSIESILQIFKYYFEKYEEIHDKPHPNIRIEQIERIIRAMPAAGCEFLGDRIELDPDDYKTLIDAHFKTQYRNCDYNINHFFSGNIRALRYYEELY